MRTAKELPKLKPKRQRLRKLPKARAHEIFEKLHEMWPNAHCELKHHNAFQLVVAVVLSAQTTDIAVNRAFGSYIDLNPTFSAADLVRLGEVKFLKIIQTIGLAPTKAKNCIRLAESLLTHFNGVVPRDREALESLAGVGRKTANVVLNVLYGEPTMAVDTHVARVSVRMGLVAETNDRVRIEKELLAVVPKARAQNAHHTLIFHGRYHCKARKPNCAECPVGFICLKIGVE